jgi:hypothetical protein
MSSGLIRRSGRYELSGDRLILHVAGSSWTPSLSHPGQAPATEREADSTERYAWRAEGDRLTLMSEAGVSTHLRCGKPP